MAKKSYSVNVGLYAPQAGNYKQNFSSMAAANKAVNNMVKSGRITREQGNQMKSAGGFSSGS